MERKHLKVMDDKVEELHLALKLFNVKLAQMTQLTKISSDH